MTKKDKKLIALIFLFSLPIIAFAQETGGIIPKCGADCGYVDFIQLLNNVISFLITLSFPVAAGVLAWAGFKFMTTGVVDERSEAKRMIKNVLIGFAIILASWVIVSTILNALLKNPGNIPVDVRVR